MHTQCCTLHLSYWLNLLLQQKHQPKLSAPCVDLVLQSHFSTIWNSLLVRYIWPLIKSPNFNLYTMIPWPSQMYTFGLFPSSFTMIFDTCPHHNQFKMKVLVLVEINPKISICSSKTFSGVLVENDILTLPQLTRTLRRWAVSCFARSEPYRQQPVKHFEHWVINTHNVHRHMRTHPHTPRPQLRWITNQAYHTKYCTKLKYPHKT